MPTSLHVSAALLSGVLIVGTAVAPAAAANSPEDLPERVDTFVADHVDRQNLAGVSVAVVRDGEVLHTMGHGHDSDGNTVTADTPMAVASISKSFTAMAVMQLVEDGQIDLETPVAHYLDDFTPVDPRAEEITVRQLLDQTSGMASQGLVSPDRGRFENTEEAVDVLAGMELTDDPGARHQYFNGNYWMAAHLVEEVTGEPFGSHLERAVFEPLGMYHSTSVTRSQDLNDVDGLADGHINVYGIPVPREEPANLIAGSGNVVTTAEDMAHWLAPYTDEGRTIEGEPYAEAATVEELLSPSAPEGRYSLGWREVAGENRMAHSGTHTGHLAYQTVTEDGLGVAVMSNGLTASYDTVQPLAVGLLDLAEGESAEQPLPVPRLIDYGFLVLTLLSVALGIRRLMRARVWAERLSDRPVRWLVLRLVPRLLPLALILGYAVAGIATIIGVGADPRFVLTLGVGTYWPPSFTVWVCVAALLNLATIVVRARYSWRARSG